jgi:hypothetical protein
VTDPEEAARMIASGLTWFLIAAREETDINAGVDDAEAEEELAEGIEKALRYLRRGGE